MSKYLTPKLVIAEAWQLTREHKKALFWYGFIPAFFGMIVSTVYVLYQVISTRHFILGAKDTWKYGELIHNAWAFLWAPGTPTLLLLILAAIVLLGYFTVPIFCRGSLIFLIEKIKKGEEVEKGMQAGIFRFVPIFEYSAIKSFASPFSFVTEGLFVLRNSTPIFPLVLPVLIILSFFGLVALFLFAYVPQIIVLQRDLLMGAIAKSSKLALHFFSETLKLFLLFLLIELRVLINIAIILFLPFAIAALTGIFATSVLSGFGIVIAVVVSIFLLSVASTISGTLEIFSTAVWTLAFHNLTPEEEKVTNF